MRVVVPLTALRCSQRGLLPAGPSFDPPSGGCSLSRDRAVGSRGGPSRAHTSSFQAMLWVLTLQFPAPIISRLLPSPVWAFPGSICPREGILRHAHLFPRIPWESEPSGAWSLQAKASRPDLSVPHGVPCAWPSALGGTSPDRVLWFLP